MKSTIQCQTISATALNHHNNRNIEERFEFFHSYPQLNVIHVFAAVSPAAVSTLVYVSIACV